MKKESNKFFASLSLMIFVTVFNLLSYAVFVFCMCKFQFDTEDIFVIFFFFILPSILWFTRIFSVVEFDKEGVKRANFKFLCKRKIKWSDVAEIRFYRFPGWIIISKRPLDYKDFNFVVERRDVIPIMYSKEVVQAIHKNTDIIINGIDDVKNI